jgi:hypothetical protein
MSSLGNNRKHIQIDIQYEHGVHRGISGRLYSGIISDKVRQLNIGGEYKYVLDDTIIYHQLSNKILRMIAAEILEK